MLMQHSDVGYLRGDFICNADQFWEISSNQLQSITEQSHTGKANQRHKIAATYVLHNHSTGAIFQIIRTYKRPLPRILRAGDLQWACSVIDHTDRSIVSCAQPCLAWIPTSSWTLRMFSFDQSEARSSQEQMYVRTCVWHKYYFDSCMCSFWYVAHIIILKYCTKCDT